MAENKTKSRGAEKAETLAAPEKEKTTKKKTTTKRTAATAKRAKAGAGGTGARATSKRTEKKDKKTDARIARAKRRQEKKLAHAKLKAERKQKRLERKLEHKERKAERIAALKEKREERKEARKERRELLKSETKEARRERIAEEKQAKREAHIAKIEARKAERAEKREHRLKIRAQKRAEKNDKRHAPGFGGWLAAVISLGVACLALGTVMTFGWISMDGMQADMTTANVRSLYELNGIIDDLDVDLAKARAASGTSDRARVLSDVAIESQTAETLLERLPFDITSTGELAAFINEMGDEAREMLYVVAGGEELSDEQLQSLEELYRINRTLKEELNAVVSSLDSGDIMAATLGRRSAIGEGLSGVNEAIAAERGATAAQSSTAKFIAEESEISAPEAEELARRYFADYGITEVNCTGEATTDSVTLYNVNITTEDGDMLAQISKLGGKVVAFDSHKDCSDRNFDIERCAAIAEDFLSNLGYADLQPVWSSESGTVCNLTFAPVQDGAVIYADEVKVKVCEQRGIVTGMEAISYVMNHGERTIADAEISRAQAQSVINGSIEVTSSRLALIPQRGGEVLCYEFTGNLGDEQYYVYVDAQTGEEIEVLTVTGTAQGRTLN